MTNPDNAIGTNGAFGGRTSPNAFNDVLSGLQGDTNDGYKGGGILSGWAVSATSADQITLGGSGLVRDVAIASDPSGNLVTVNNISGQPISVTMPAKPTSGSRSDGVIAYVQNPPQGTNIVVDNPGACGIIGVAGTGYQVLSDQTIREAITADGGDGANAYYVVLATVVRYYRETTINQAEVKTGKQLAVQPLRNKFPIKVSDITGVDELNSNSANSKIDSVGATAVTLNTYTVPKTGIYAVSARVSTAITGATKHILVGELLNGSNSLMTLAEASIANYAGNNSASARGGLTWKFNQGDVIKLMAAVQNTTTAVSYTMYVQQIW